MEHHINDFFLVLRVKSIEGLSDQSRLSVEVDIHGNKKKFPLYKTRDKYEGGGGSSAASYAKRSDANDISEISNIWNFGDYFGPTNVQIKLLAPSYLSKGLEIASAVTSLQHLYTKQNEQDKDLNRAIWWNECNIKCPLSWRKKKDLMKKTNSWSSGGWDFHHFLKTTTATTSATTGQIASTQYLISPTSDCMHKTMANILLTPTANTNSNDNK